MTTKGILALIAVCLLVPVLFVTYALLARYVIHGPVNDQSLAWSVATDGGSPFPDLANCDRIGRAATWTCTLTRDGSAAAHYRVRRRGDSSCWDARRIRGEGDRRLRGCVHRWQWELI
jgi:hypothetical protein